MTDITTEQFRFADYNLGFVIAITLRAKEGERETVANLLASLVKPTMEEPGVKLFLPYRSPDNIREFYLYELYTDEAGWQAHKEQGSVCESYASCTPKVLSAINL